MSGSSISNAAGEKGEKEKVKVTSFMVLGQHIRVDFHSQFNMKP